MADKLETIQAALDNNPAINSIELRGTDFSAAILSGGFALIHNFYVAPDVPIYKAKGLDRLAQNLVPELIPDPPTSEFSSEDGLQTWWKAGSGLVIGVRRYSETAGNILIKGCISIVGQSVPDLSVVLPVRRITTVRLYPDTKLAIQAANGEVSSREIPANEVRSARKSNRKYDSMLSRLKQI